MPSTECTRFSEEQRGVHRAFKMSYSPFTGVARNIVVISSTVKPFAH